jgi:ankyrin repeat protein
MDWNDTPDIIPTLLDYEGLNVPDDDGRMPLHYAADLGCPRYVKLLSQSTHLEAVDLQGQTALHVAARGGHLQAIKDVLACNVKRRELSQATTDALLYLAASVGNLQIVQSLVDHGAGIWHRDSSGKTAVEMAVELKKAPLTMYLMELVLSSSRAEDLPPGWVRVARTCPLNDAPSALHHAISRNYQNVALALIEDGEDIFKTNASGETVLSLAVHKVAGTVVRALVGKYADAIFTAKELEKAIRVQAAASHKPLDAYCYLELERPCKDMLLASWTAVMHLEEVFNLTNDPDMRRPLTPAWETMSWEIPSQPMGLGMDLTPSTLHGRVIDSSAMGSTQLREVRLFGTRRISHHRHARIEKSGYSRLAKRQQYPFDTEEESEGEDEDGDEEWS